MSRLASIVAPLSAAHAIVLAALFGASLFGCETLRVGANPEVPSWVHRPSYSMYLHYERDLLADSRKSSVPYERGQPEIDVAGRRVFIGSSDGGLYAIGADDGEVLWRFETLGAVQCEPLYDPATDAVYFGSNDGALYKVKAGRGELEWRFMTNAEVAHRPVLNRGTLYVVNANDTLLALDPSKGSLRWSQHRPPALGMEVAGYSGALVWDNAIYVAFSSGLVAAFDAQTGSELWQPVDLSAEAEQVLGTLPKYLDVDTTPAPGQIDGRKVIYTGSYQGGIYALDAETGSTVWSNTEVGGVTDLLVWQQPAHSRRPGLGEVSEGAPWPARSLLIASTGVSGIWALDPLTGEEVWRRALSGAGVSRPVPALGALLVSTTGHGLFLLSVLDGNVIDGLHTGEGFSMPAAAHGTRAFILTNTGKFLALAITPPI